MANNNIVEFTISNLNLRIDKLYGVVGYNENKLMFAKRDGNDALVAELNEKLEKQNATINGYENALKKLNNQGSLTDEDIDFIVKSLNVRKNNLAKRVEECSHAIKQHTRALQTKEPMVVGHTPIGSVTMEHYDDVSMSVIEKATARLERINSTIEKCNRGIAIFGALK